MFRRLAKTLIKNTHLNQPRRSPPRVMFYPPFNDQEELLDAFYKAQFYLPPALVDKVILPVSFNVKIDDLKDGRPEYVGQIDLPGAGYIRLVNDHAVALSYRCLMADYLLITDWSRKHENGILRNCAKKLVNVDRHKNQFDGWAWGDFLTELQPLQKLANQREAAKNKFLQYCESLPRFSKAYVFGTGPSLEQAYDYDLSDGYRIVCNTIVKNQPLLEHIQPHFLVAADAIYHFGNNLHACQFRRDLSASLHRDNFMFIMPERFYPLIEEHHPDLRKYTLPVREDVRGIFLDMRKEFAYTSQHNILNALLLPLASTLAEQIFLLGFDGRNANDQLFWKNSAASSYPELKPSIMRAHPGFFDKMDYREYARWQSAGAEKIMELGESKGKQYVCLNETTIPALQARQIRNSTSVTHPLI
jgi:hypothetical protein